MIRDSCCYPLQQQQLPLLPFAPLSLPQSFHSCNMTDSQPPSYERCEEMSQVLLSLTPVRPVVGIITGSGLGSLADLIEDPKVSIPYTDIPEFAPCSVVGHEGQLVFGTMSKVPVVLMKGRFHPYEGHAGWRCSLPVRLMKLMGVKVLVLTNASGGLNPRLSVGDIILIKDHISISDIMGESPLKGPNDERWGPRFPSINNIYPKGLRKVLMETVEELGLQSMVSEGVYCYNSGPTYATVSEIRFMRDCLKGDVCGMSTAYEATTAAHCGLPVLGLSLVSDLCITDYDSEKDIDHESVVAAVEKRVPGVVRLMLRLLTKLGDSSEFL